MQMFSNSWMGEVSPLYDHDRMIIWGLEIMNVSKTSVSSLEMLCSSFTGCSSPSSVVSRMLGDAATTVEE